MAMMGSHAWAMDCGDCPPCMELDGVRKELADVRARSTALERELAGGFAGLLKGKVRKRLGLEDDKD